MQNLITISDKKQEFALPEEFCPVQSIVPSEMVAYWLNNKQSIEAGNDSLYSVGAISVMFSHFTPIERFLEAGTSISNVIKYAAVGKINEIIKAKNKEIETGNPEALAMAATVMNMESFINSSVQSDILSYAFAYLGASADMYDERTLSILMDYIKQQMATEYRGFSMHEVSLAFQAASRNPDLKIYYGFNAAIFNKIMSAYKDRRNRFISDIEKGTKKQLYLTTVVPAKAEEGYIEHMKEYKALQDENKRYKSFNEISLAYLNTMEKRKDFLLNADKIKNLKVLAHRHTVLKLYVSTRKHIALQRNFLDYIHSNIHVFKNTLSLDNVEGVAKQQISEAIDKFIEKCKTVLGMTLPAPMSLAGVSKNEYHSIFSAQKWNTFLRMCYFYSIAEYSGESEME
jgi:hypothetical protein